MAQPEYEIKIEQLEAHLNGVRQIVEDLNYGLITVPAALMKHLYGINGTLSLADLLSRVRMAKNAYLGADLSLDQTYALNAGGPGTPGYVPPLPPLS